METLNHGDSFYMKRTDRLSIIFDLNNKVLRIFCFPLTELFTQFNKEQLFEFTQSEA